MHLGVVSPPVPGHLHPFGALGRELIARGHRVTLFHMPDLAERVRKEELEFVAIGESDHPLGSLPVSLQRLGQLDGLAALRFTIEAIRKTTEMMCRDLPAAIEKSGVHALLVDQTEPAGGTVADHLKLPFVTVCNALTLSDDPDVPPPFTAWNYRPGIWSRLRNRIGYAAGRRMTAPVWNVVQRYRKTWRLPPLKRQEDSFSRLAQISQQPEAFDFPRRNLPRCFHYVGPIRRPSAHPVAFPWEKLDGRPVIYASLGTLQNQKETLFRTFAQACEGLGVQLVITHGGGLTASVVGSFPGDPLVVSYAPQLEVLGKASLTLTHAGLNTVLDSLTHGVPLVAVPITYEQPAIASRIRWAGVGEVIPLKTLSSSLLRSTIRRVLAESGYSDRAKAVRQSILDGGGTAKAATVVEGCL
jgi:zeaxanthin glucosyltransferase